MSAEPKDATSAPGDSSDALLEVDGLRLGLGAEGKRGDDGEGELVRGVGFRVAAGEAVALVGESGCGKTLTALSLLGLLPRGIVRRGGSIRIDGAETPSDPADRRWRRIRGRRVGLVFQEPASALNPVLRVGTQVAEAVRVASADAASADAAGGGRREIRRRGLDLLRRVALPDPERRWYSYPHELSGGQRQRVMIAMALAGAALAGAPGLLVADEPTTALDVTVQAQILDLLAGLRREMGLALLLITHDLAVVSETCERLLVMHEGQIVERGTTRAVLASPEENVTRELLRVAGGSAA